ncbi:MoxR family ATPase [Candidatus Woesearchaeota archaeon]|nr:MoxR family ATPase [Candidatus Woesearchaeota archaeon]
MVSPAKVRDVHRKIARLKEEVGKLVVGQEDVLDGIIRGVLANGHVLVEGLPGVAKTLLIKTLASAIGGNFGRIQFTVDMLPSDITGLTTYNEQTGFTFTKGPIFANLVIADEINRAPPKTQSALLEAMQEEQVTVSKVTHKLPLPFFVMATINPIESSGTYPLPEAQIDRFLFKLYMHYPKKEEEKRIIEQNATIKKFEEYKIRPVVSTAEILKMQELTKQIGHRDAIKQYIVEIVNATRYPEQYNLQLGKYVDYGSSPRAAINLFIAAKAAALMEGEVYVKPKHIKKVAKDVLRHRIILNYSGQAEGVSTDALIDEILDKVPIP